MYSFKKEQTHSIASLRPYAESPLSPQCEVIIKVLMDFSLTVKTATLIFISGRGSAISSAKQGKSGSFYNLVEN